MHPALVTAILTGSAFLAGVDLFIVNVAFDEIGRDFGTASLGRLSWILNAYAVVYAALLVPMGRLTDRYGRRSGFVAGLAIFTLASLGCGLAPGVWWLVALRVVQAVGAAAMTPASLGLLLAVLPPERRAAGARLWAMTGALAAALGPAAGGALVQLSWQWAFWINVPLGVLLVVLAWRYVPDVRHNLDAPRPDLLGGVVLIGAIGALVLGLVQGNDWGWAASRTLTAFVVGVLLLGLFAWQNRRHAAPVLDPRLFAVPSFTWANLATLIFNAGFGAALLGGILWMQHAWDYSALRTGLAIALGPLAVPITAQLAPRVLPRVPPGRLVVAGCLAFAAAAVWQAAGLSTSPAYWSTFLPAWILAGIGVGLASPNLVAAATSAAPSALGSTASGVVSMARQVGIAVGVAILVGVVGSGAPDLDRARAAWLVVAGTCALAALAALAAVAMEAARRSAVELAVEAA